ncbi:MAG TPA: asparagine synthase-related protein, partial [Patescibacteria group bacterium]|nr:asparagine synthase-related protein [Patescibacteria group bacterium]
GRLLLARDPFGEKPLYYVATPAGVAFASEIKALRAAGALPDLGLCAEAIDAYLAFTYIPAPRTIFRHVRKVPGGHCVVIDLRGLASGAPDATRTARYWKLPDRVGESADGSQMAAMLRDALRRRCPPGEPAAVYLSGGLDSSVVVALAARESSRRLPTFSVGFKEAGLDESAHARRVADLFHCDHHEILLDDVGPDLVTAVIDQLDEPMADAATIPTWVLGREASTCARVALTGDGADALLAGDHWFRRLHRLDAMERLPRVVRAAIPVAAALSGPSRYRRYRDLVALIDQKQAQRYLSIREKWGWRQRMEIYAEDFRRGVDLSATEGSYLLAPVDWRQGESVDAAIRLDTMHGLPEDLLMKADKMGMAHGIESRTPFMDRRFAEWAARLEPGLLLRGSGSKYLLKKAAEALLPRDLIYRRKHGFQVPVGRWLKGSLRGLTEAAFEPAMIGRQGLFDAEALGRLEARFHRGPCSAALDGRVWQIVALQTWWRRVFEP